MKTIYVAIDCVDDVAVAEVHRLLTDQGNRYWPTYQSAVEACCTCCTSNECECEGRHLGPAVSPRRGRELSLESVFND